MPQIKALPLVCPLQVAPQTPLSEALTLMSQAGSDRPSTVVVVEDSQLVGTLSAQDVVRLAAAGKPLQTMSVAEGMNPHPVTTTSEAQISTILDLVQHHKELPIVDEHHHVQGLVTLESLNRVLSREWLDINITAHKRSEKQLRFQAQLLDAVEQAAIAIDLEGHITYWNRYAETLYGWTAEAVLGQPILEVTPAPGMEAAASAIMARLQVGESWSGEFPVQRRDGTTFEAMVILSPVYDESGLSGMIGVSTDISKHKQAERQLQDSKARFQAFMDHSPAIAFMVDRSGRTVYANSLLAQFLGTEQPNSVLPSAVLQQHRANDRQVLETGQPIEVIEACPDQAGNWRNWLVCKFPLTNTDGETLVGGIGIDITERQRSAQALRDSEARFQEIAHTISQLFFVRSAKTGQFLYVSPAYETLWGRTCKSLYQNPDSWLDSVHPEDREQVLISLDEQFKEPVRREYRIRRPDGEIRWISARIVLVRDQSEPARWIGFAEDITERKEAEEALRQSQLRLQQLSTFVPAVLYSVVQRAEEPLQFEYISSGVETIYEIEPERALQAANLVYQQILPADRQVFFERVRQTVHTLAPFQHEWRIITPSGQQKWLQAVAQTERRPDGAIAWHGVMLDISDRQQAEIERQQTYQRLRFHIENTPLAVIEWDREFRVQSWSPQAEAMFGWHSEEVVGKRWSDWRFVLEEDRETVKEAAQRLLNGSEPRNSSPSRNLTKAGTVVYCEWYNSALVDEQGNVVSVLSLAENVTERKQIENRLREREQFLSSIYNGVEQAIFVVDVTPAQDFRYVDWNPTAAQVMGLRAAQIKDKTLEEVFDSELAALARERFTLCLQRGTTIVREDYLPVAGGTWWLHTFTPLRNEQGEIYRIVGTASNTTERKQLEQERDRLLQRVEEHNRRLEDRVRERTLELQQAHRQLQQSERKFRGAFDTLAVGMTIVSVNGGFVEVNGALCRMLGYSETELLKLSFHEITHPEDLRADPAFEQMMVGEIPAYQAEKRYLRKDKQVVWGWLSMSLMRVQGQPLYFIVQIQDISDRQRAEIQIRTSEARLAEAQRIAHIGSWEFELDTQKILWSAELFRIFGRDPAQGEPTYPQLVQLIHPDHRAPFQQAVERAIATGEPYTFDLMILRADGVRYLESRGEAVFNLQGQVIKLVGTAMDITERQQANQALRESEERFRQLAENINAVFFVQSLENHQDRNLYVSPAYEKVWGHSVESVRQQPDSWLKSVHPNDRERVVASYAQQLEGEAFQEEYRIVRPDGGVRWILARTFPIRDRNGRVYRQVGIAEDITERKQAEIALAQKLERERLMMAIAQHIRHSLDLDDILATAVRDVQQLLGADRVSVFQVAPDGYGRVVAEAVMPGQPTILGQEFPDERFPDEYYELYSDGHVRIVADVATDAIAHCIAEFLLELGVQSKLSVPILQGNKLWGVMTVHHCWETHRSWQPWELELLEELALQLAIAIGQSELYYQLQRELSQKERSLAEKEVLLKEVHHRVKNNLQIISSLLWMQSRQVEGGALSLFKDSQSRIQTMALIHEQLYQSADLAQIDFEQYLQMLMRSLLRSYGVREAIALDITVQAPPLTIDVALPCGLIVSELVSNAFKYAFPDRSTGKIGINFSTNADQLELQVSDNGIGLPDAINFRHSPSLGLLVVCDLTEQLDGTIDLNRTDGTTFTITFPYAGG